MPIYEYACGCCSHHFEVMQKISEGLKRKCPACGKLALKKMISQVAFRLKGSGWYETDFKTKPKPDAKEATKTATKSDDSSSTSDSGGSAMPSSDGVSSTTDAST